VVWSESKWLSLEQRFGYKTLWLAGDQALPRTWNINHPLKGPPRANSVAYTSSVRAPKFALLHMKSAV
jgi:hypothetical protein